MAKHKLLTKSDLLFGDLKIEKVDIPALNGFVYIKELSGLGLLQYRGYVDALKDEFGKDAEVTVEQSLELMAKLVSLTVCDANGNLMFTEDEAKQLMNVSIYVLQTLAEKAMQICGMDNKIVDEVKDNLKNAEASPSTAS